MPELPEVETVVRELNTELSGLKIKAIKIHLKRMFKSAELMDTILNKEIESVTRRAKYIVFNFKEKKSTLIAHLRMTGKFLFKLENEQDKKHAHIEFTLNTKKKMYYVDPRTFGGFEISQNFDTYFSHIGVEPLSDLFTVEYLKLKLKNTRSIKAFLLDQQNIAGLGNIYVDESLFLSKIRPERKCESVTKSELKKLVSSIKFILEQAVNNMGTTLSDYRNTRNISGENQNYLQVYGQENLPCYVCQTPIIKIKLAGRGTHYCKKCQK